MCLEGGNPTKVGFEPGKTSACAGVAELGLSLRPQSAYARTISLAAAPLRLCTLLLRWGFALCTLRARLSPLCSALCDTGFALATWHFVFPLRLPASDFRLQPLHFDFALVVRLCTCHFVFALRLCTCHFTITSSLHFAFATSGFAVRALRFSRCTSHLPLCTCYLVLRSAPHITPLLCT